MRHLSARELAAWLADPDPARARPVVIDVREPWEVAIAALPDSVNIPMGEVVARADSIDRDRPVVCLCHHGMRSLQVAAFLARRGFDDVWNLSGGIDAWAREVDPSCPLY